MKKTIVIASLGLLFSCKNKSFHDLKTGEMTSKQVEEIMGRPDAIESSQDEASKVEYWHYYDLALELHLRNDTLRVVLETSDAVTGDPKKDLLLSH